VAEACKSNELPVVVHVSVAIDATGFASIVTGYVHELVQPALEVMLSVNVKDPAAPALTVTEEPVAEPWIVPLPVIDQLWEAMLDPVEE